jgi:TPR repeat protein
MGYVFEFGLGVPKNCDRAEEWYGKAAYQGDEEALEILENFTCRDYDYVAFL